MKRLDSFRCGQWCRARLLDLERMAERFLNGLFEEKDVGPRESTDKAGGVVEK